MFHNIRDKELFDFLRQGNRRAFDIFFLRHFPVLRSYAAQFVGFHDAEELAQELMVGIWENRAEIAVESSVQAYLFRATRNKCINLIEKRLLREEAHMRIAGKWLREEDPDCYVDRELADKIEVALEQLPGTYREAFVMSRMEGKSYNEIARALAVSPKTVDYRIQQALKILRLRLRDYLAIALLAAAIA